MKVWGSISVTLKQRSLWAWKLISTYPLFTEQIYTQQHYRKVHNGASTTQTELTGAFLATESLIRQASRVIFCDWRCSRFWALTVKMLVNIGNSIRICVYWAKTGGCYIFIVDTIACWNPDVWSCSSCSKVNMWFAVFGYELWSYSLVLHWADKIPGIESRNIINFTFFFFNERVN